MFKKKERPAPSVLKQMEASLHPVIFAPFNGKLVSVIARELNHVQIKSCGDFSLIETFQDKINNKEKSNFSFHERVKFAEIQHNIVKLSLLNPKHDDIIDMILKYENITVKGLEEQLDEIQEQYDSVTDLKKKQALQNQYARLELQYRYLLPGDFLGFIFSFALGVDSSDIKKVSEEMLYSATIKAKLGNNNPSDHLHGAFSDFNKEDINDRAWVHYHDKIKNNNPNKRSA